VEMRKECEWCGSGEDVVEVRIDGLWLELCLECRKEELVV